MIYRTVLLEDNPDDRDSLLGYMARTPFLSVTATFADPLVALPFLTTEPVDLLLLDLHLPGLTGYEVVRSLPRPPAIIMTTSSLTDSLEAFEVGAIDYLVKPIRYERFLRAINRVLSRPTERTLTEQLPKPESLVLKQGHDLVRIAPGQISHLEAVGTFTSVHLVGQPPLLVSHLLNQVLEKLPADQFVRVHRSFAVAVAQISRLSTHQLFVGETPIPVGRTYQQELRERFG
jgi:two-component system, LytTR family, response regulator